MRSSDDLYVHTYMCMHSHSYSAIRAVATTVTNAIEQRFTTQLLMAMCHSLSVWPAFIHNTVISHT